MLFDLAHNLYLNPSSGSSAAQRSPLRDDGSNADTNFVSIRYDCNYHKGIYQFNVHYLDSFRRNSDSPSLGCSPHLQTLHFVSLPVNNSWLRTQT